MSIGFVSDYLVSIGFVSDYLVSIGFVSDYLVSTGFVSDYLVSIGFQIVHESDLREPQQVLQEKRVEGKALVDVLVARGQHPDVAHGVVGIGGHQLQKDSAISYVVELHHHTPWK